MWSPAAACAKILEREGGCCVESSREMEGLEDLGSRREEEDPQKMGLERQIRV